MKLLTTTPAASPSAVRAAWLDYRDLCASERMAGLGYADFVRVHFPGGVDTSGGWRHDDAEVARFRAEAAEQRARFDRIADETGTTAAQVSEIAAALAGDAAPRRAPSERQVRLRRVDMDVPMREKLRRLLNARCTSLHKLTGEYVDDLRHDAVSDATGGRTDSSMDRTVTEDEMGHACTYVEDRLFHAGFDFDAEDAAYWERRAAREALTNQTQRLAA
ncbi:MAG TPA: hypothetical protein VGB53_00910 [Rubricoccaceae bacterium]|jgi:hypothetical protein